MTELLSGTLIGFVAGCCVATVGFKEYNSYLRRLSINYEGKSELWEARCLITEARLKRLQAKNEEIKV